MDKKKISIGLLITVICTTTFASNFRIDGTIPHKLHLPTQGTQATSLKTISLEHITLSKAAKTYLATHKQPIAGQLVNLSLAPSAALGMNEVPVLDQGQHGSCVTFAVTGAMDAVLGDNTHTQKSDDYYSELCSLELGQTLENASPVDEKGKHLYPSGWNGSLGVIVLQQIDTYGLVPISYQKTQGCAGVYSYDKDDGDDTGRPMTKKEFKAHSDKEPTFASYKIILASEDAYSDRSNMNDVLTKTKMALAAGHRVVFGTLIDISVGSLVAGALGSYQSTYDTWILTPDIATHAEKNQIEDGHEMIITGYDDNAVVEGPDAKHVGVLSLRNSWGKYAGDHGNYYMTYDYFLKLANEVEEILPVTKS